MSDRVALDLDNYLGARQTLFEANLAVFREEAAALDAEVGPWCSWTALEAAEKFLDALKGSFGSIEVDMSSFRASVKGWLAIEKHKQEMLTHDLESELVQRDLDLIGLALQTLPERP